MRTAILSTIVATSAFALVACSGGGAPREAADGGSQSFTGTCCLNGAFYSCSTETAFNLCAGFDAAACHDACGADLACHMRCDQMAAMATHDPSQCTRDPSRDGQCTVSPSSCQDNPANPSCTVSADCPSGNCTNGRCYDRSVGQLCTVSADCDSGNCTSGCCQGRSVGSPCTVSADCDSGNCTSGTCQGRGFGSPCTVSADCDSGNCSDGTCQ